MSLVILILVIVIVITGYLIYKKEILQDLLCGILVVSIILLSCSLIMIPLMRNAIHCYIITYKTENECNDYITTSAIVKNDYNSQLLKWQYNNKHGFNLYIPDEVEYLPLLKLKEKN